MVEPITLTTLGVLVSPIATDLVKGALEDYVKDFFKDAVKDVETLAQKPFAWDAVKESLTAFARLFLQQLAELGLNEKQLQHFVNPLKQFITEPTVQQVLGAAFSANFQQVDTEKLQECWQTARWDRELNSKQAQTSPGWSQNNPEPFDGEVLPATPAGFDWLKLGEAYRQAVREYLKTEVFGKHWRDESWHEVLRSISGMLDEQLAGEIIEFLMGVEVDRSQFLSEEEQEKGKLKPEGLMNLLLAADCFSEVENSIALESLGNSLLIALQREVEHQEIELTTDAVEELLGRISQYFSDTLEWVKKLVLDDQREDVRGEAVCTIASNYKEQPDTLEWLKELVLNDDRQNVQWVAARAIAHSYKEQPDTLEWLKKLVLNDDRKNVRMAAFWAIADFCKEQPNTLEWLKQRVLDDPSENVRMAAFWAIATGWKDDPDTLPLLKNATTDENWAVRQAAVRAIATGWKDDPDTLPWLKKATTDENGDVRQAAVEAIASGWINEPGIFELLSQIARTDPFIREEYWQGSPRQTALKALLKNYADRAEVVEILRDRFLNDPDKKLRQFAREKLSKWDEKQEIR